MRYDVHIVGGGPAGVSAALWLSRACRRVLLSDTGIGRNAAATVMHGVPTRDGINPARFRRLASRELETYQVEQRAQRIERAWVISRPRQKETSFGTESSDGKQFFSRKLLLATGVRDRLPEIPGLRPLYGKSVFHCPFCDGWERRGKRLVAFGRGNSGVGLGLMLRTWSRRVWVCTDGIPIKSLQQARLSRNGIRWTTRKVVELDADGTSLRRLIFDRGRPLACDALFFNTGQFDRSGLAWQLGCEPTRTGGVRIDERGRTGVRGLFLAGDASHEVQFVITAAADGARAAVAINRELQDEDRA